LDRLEQENQFIQTQLLIKGFVKEGITNTKSRLTRTHITGGR